MSCFPLVTHRNFWQSLQRSWEQSHCTMDIHNNPINLGVHQAEATEHWASFSPLPVLQPMSFCCIFTCELCWALPLWWHNDDKRLHDYPDMVSGLSQSQPHLHMCKLNSIFWSGTDKWRQETSFPSDSHCTSLADVYWQWLHWSQDSYIIVFDSLPLIRITQFMVSQLHSWANDLGPYNQS